MARFTDLGSKRTPLDLGLRRCYGHTELPVTQEDPRVPIGSDYAEEDGVWINHSETRSSRVD